MDNHRSGRRTSRVVYVNLIWHLLIVFITKFLDPKIQLWAKYYFATETSQKRWTEFCGMFKSEKKTVKTGLFLHQLSVFVCRLKLLYIYNKSKPGWVRIIYLFFLFFGEKWFLLIVF